MRRPGDEHLDRDQAEIERGLNAMRREIGGIQATIIIGQIGDLDHEAHIQRAILELNG